MNCTDEEVEVFLKSTEFPVMKNVRILKAARGETPDKLPIWIMRQAGRYLPEFREMRKKHSFFEICQSPKLACEVTLMPIRRYELDAAIIFSDILVIPQALGMEVIMEPEKGPVFPRPLSLDNIHELQWDDAVKRLEYVGQAIRLTRHQLEGKVPLIGFSAAPWTLFVYMMEGGGTKTASKAKRFLYESVKLAHNLFKMLADLIAEYIVMQVRYGAQMIQIFESSAEYLGRDMYETHLLPHLKSIHSNVKEKLRLENLPAVPLIFFAKGGAHFLDDQARIGFDVIGLDWNTEPDICKGSLYKNITLQGNLDPCALYANREDLRKYVDKMVTSFGLNRHIVNLGHGIYPDAPPEAVEWLIDFVHSYAPATVPV